MRLPVLFILIAAVCASCWLSYCNSGKALPVVFTVGGAPAEVDFWEKIADDCFNATGIHLELLRQPTDTDMRRQNLITSLRAKKSTPDIFLMDVAWISQFAASGWLEPLEPLCAAYGLLKDQFFLSVVNQTDYYDSSLIALPVYIDGGILYYRKDLLKKYGYATPPTLWNELTDCAQKIGTEQQQNNPSFNGFLWQGAQYEGLVCTFLEFCGSAAPAVTLATGDSLIINTLQNRRALQFMHDCIHSTAISPQTTYTTMREEEVRMAFQNGDALFERNWPYAWKLHQAQDSPVKGKVGVTLLPHFPGERSASVLGGWHIGISKYSKRKKTAAACVAYLLSAAVQKKCAITLGWNPGRADCYNDSAVLAAMPHAPVLKQAFEHAVARPAVPYYSYISSVLQRHLSAAIAGKVKAADALTACEKELKTVIERYSR